MEHICKTCNKNFYTPKSRDARGNVSFCCKKCFVKYQRGKNHPKYIDNNYSFNCKHCNKLIIKKSSIINKFCSTSCAAKHGNHLRKKELVKKCIICSKLIPDKNNYCSLNCMSIDYKIKLRGTNNPNYINGEYINQPNNVRIGRLKCARKIKTHTDKEWGLLLEKHNHKCVKCGDFVRLEKDHIIPLSKGGHDGIDNLQPLCKRCNRKKFTKTIRYAS